MYHEVDGIKFYERRCFGIFTRDIEELMRNYKRYNGEEYKKYDGNLSLHIEPDTLDIYLYDHDELIYDEDDIAECVSDMMGVEINNVFFDGDEFGGVLYFVERKLE